MTHLYALLGVHAASTTEEVRLARKALAQRYHPDRYPQHAALMAEVNAAVATLTGPGAARYRLGIGKGPCGACRGRGWVWGRSLTGSKPKVPCLTCQGAGRV